MIPLLPLSGPALHHSTASLATQTKAREVANYDGVIVCVRERENYQGRIVIEGSEFDWEQVRNVGWIAVTH